MILYKPWQFFLFIIFVLAVAIISIPSSEKLGQIYFDSYQYDKALIYFNKVNTLEENNLPTLKKLKEYFLIQGAVKEALEVQKKLVFLRPKNISYIEELEQLYDWSQQPILKIQTMKTRADLLAPKDRINLYKEMLSGLRWLRNYQEADQLAKYIVLDPILKTNSELIEMVIDYFLATQKSEDAIHLLELNIVKNPNDSRSLERVAEAYWVEKNYEMSIIFNQRLLGISEEQSNQIELIAENILQMDKAKVRNSFSYIEIILDGLLKLKRLDLVVKTRKSLVKLLPEDPNLKFVLIESYLSNNMVGEATELLRSFEHESFKNMDSIYEASSRLNDLGNIPLAIRLMERLVSKFPKHTSFLEFLGDLYEKNGQKEKAIEMYFKIIELKKTQVFKSMPKFLVAMNDNNHIELPLIPAKYNLKKTNFINQDKQIKRVKQKVLYLIDELDDPDKKLVLLNKLLIDSPNEKQLLTRIGFIYFSKGDSISAYRYFNMAHIVAPEDVEILEILVRKDIEEKKWNEAHINIEKLKARDAYIDLKEELLFQSQSSEHTQLCNELTLKETLKTLEKEVLSRCYFRQGKYKHALELSSELGENDPHEVRYQFLILSSCLELKDRECSNSQLTKLANQFKISNDELKPYEDYLDEIKSEFRRLNAWGLHTYFQLNVYKSWTVYTESLEVSKRVESVGISTEFQNLHFAQYSEFNIKKVNLLGHYYSEKHRVSLGPSFYKGKTSSVSPNFEWNYGQPKYFIDFKMTGDRPSLSSRELVENDVRTRQVEVYSEQQLSKRFSMSEAGSLYQARSSDILGSGHNIRFDTYYKLWGELPLLSGVAIANSKSKAKNDSVLFQNNFLAESTLYGLAVVKSESYSFYKFPRYDWDMKFEIFGDLDRELAFGRILNIFARMKYLYDFDKSIDLSSSWGQETNAEVKGESWEFKLNWSHWW